MKVSILHLNIPVRLRFPLLILIFLFITGCTPLPSPVNEQGTEVESPSALPTSRLTLTSTAVPTRFSTATALPSATPTLLSATETATHQPSPSLTAKMTTPTHQPTVTLRPSSTPSTLKGSVVSGQMDTSLLAQPLNYLIYLPPGYSAQGSQHYPTLYLLHGVDFTDDQWVRLGMTTTADRLIDSGQIPPLIIVMPEEDTFPMPDQTNFGTAVATALVPWIDAHYLTQPLRSERAIGGLSRGAAWAMHLGFIYWQTFGIIGAHSFPMFYGDDLLLPGWVKAIPEDSYPRIYIDIGTRDSDLSQALKFEQSLTSLGIPHEFHLFTGYHDENYWSSHVEEYLRWYTSGW